MRSSIVAFAFLMVAIGAKGQGQFSFSNRDFIFMQSSSFE